MQRKTLFIALALAFAGPGAALASGDLDRLRAEFEQKLKDLQTAYEARLQEMEARLDKYEAESRTAADSARQAQATAPTDAAGPANAFNPDISLILQGRYYSADGDGHITGFLPAGHAHGPEKGFSVDHTELAMGASIDPYFRGYANFAFVDDTVDTEEAWVQTTALDNGLTLKAGRYLSGIGYTNELHPHAWDFADQNLAYAAMLGEHYAQDGLQLKWVAPTPVFLELGLELAQGADWGDRNGPGSKAAYVHVGDDVGASHSWRAGLSHLRVKAEDREGHWEDDHGEEAETLFSGTSKYWIADFVWKWAPEGNPRYRNFKFQAEYVRRQEDGDLTCADNAGAGGACLGGITDRYDARQSGWYAQGVYQFHPEWRLGYRYDRLDVGSVDFGPGFAGVLSKPDFTPKRQSLMLDYNPSEFSRLRLQFARDEAEQGLKDDQVTLQYIHSLGPHGAHRF